MSRLILTHSGDLSNRAENSNAYARAARRVTGESDHCIDEGRKFGAEQMDNNNNFVFHGRTDVKMAAEMGL